MINKYEINFQHLPKGAARPIDDGETIECKTDGKGFMLVPNVGDFVHIVRVAKDDYQMTGRVKSRMFRYMGEYCAVNIVVEETDDDWGLLVKE